MTRRILAELVAMVAALVLVLVILGTANPLPHNNISTDRLGPESGEKISDYLARAGATLALSTDAEVQHWALVSFTREISAADAIEVVGSSRISQVLLRVPIARVQTPVLTVDVPGDAESVGSAASYAASRLYRSGAAETSTSAADTAREEKIDSVTVSRLISGCSCVVALTVRANLTQLQKQAQAAGVRSVEALPADAQAGRFSVTPLLPEQVEFASPLPDDGVVPDS